MHGQAVRRIAAVSLSCRAHVCNVVTQPGVRPASATIHRFVHAITVVTFSAAIWRRRALCWKCVSSV